MAVEFNLNRPESDDFAIADRHLYLDRTESVVLEEGDPASAFQFVARGHPISKADAARLGLSVVDGKILTTGQATDEAPQEKETSQETSGDGTDAPSAAKKPAAKKPPAKKRK